MIAHQQKTTAGYVFARITRITKSFMKISGITLLETSQLLQRQNKKPDELSLHRILIFTPDGYRDYN